ncbi:MAG: hypothetical protein DBX04_00875 [Candidatus Poseidoniales archaeon]|nr:MAG: hypothetical protein DBX04_00875 [Candidatus Poseidoniales archaeon]
MVLPQLLAELICHGFFFALFGGTGTTSKPPTKLSSPTQRRSNQLINCAVEGCNALTFRSTDYCWRHQDEPPLDSEPDPEQEPNWWEDNQGE